MSPLKITSKFQGMSYHNIKGAGSYYYSHVHKTPPRLWGLCRLLVDGGRCRKSVGGEEGLRLGNSQETTKSRYTGEEVFSFVITSVILRSANS